MIAISNCTCLCLCTVLKESQLPPPSLEASAAALQRHKLSTLTYTGGFMITICR